MSVLVARRLPIPPFLVGAALVGWLITIDRMRGVDVGPGTDLGSLGWYVGIWVTMMAAMMLPSIRRVRDLDRGQPRHRAGADAA